MGVPTKTIAGCAHSHATLVAALGDLDDDGVRAPSLLPGWSVGHVLSHLARNAESVVRRLEGAINGEVLDQYVGGSEARNAAIEAGADRSALELVDDVARTNAQVDELVHSLAPEIWDRPTRVHGEVRPAYLAMFSRWREVEVHHVDLGRGYSFDQWPKELLDVCLAYELPTLATRADPAQLFAWITGRAAAPGLGSWFGGFDTVPEAF
jgi:maleylpyruvate isomerase